MNFRTSSLLVSVMLFNSCGNPEAPLQGAGPPREAARPRRERAGNASEPVAATGFSAVVALNGADGSRPFGDVLASGGNLYGAGSEMGEHGGGSLFRVTPGGSLTVLHQFRQADGTGPFGRLCDGGDRIFGITTGGGMHGNGTLYAIGHDGSGFRVLHHFKNGDPAGGSPKNGPILVGRQLIGTAFHGGVRNGFAGCVYCHDLDSGKTEMLAELGGEAGFHPSGSLLFHDGWVYGMTSDYERKEPDAHGAIFRLRPDGSEFKVLHRFAAGDGHPYDCLAASPDGWLYGTTHGTFSNPEEHGSVFRIQADGSRFETVISFSGCGQRGGSKPNGSVVFSSDGRFLYGSTHGNNQRGGNRPGTLYAIDLKSKTMQVLHVFDGGTNGATPMRTPVLVGSRLFGLAAHAGKPGENYPDGHGLLYGFAIPEAASLSGGLPLDASFSGH